MDPVDFLGAASYRERTKRRQLDRKGRFGSTARTENSGTGTQGAKVGFAALLSETGASDIEDLLDRVNEAGDHLRESQTLGAIRAYRSAVSAFLRYVVAHVLQVSEHTSGANVLKRKKFTLVEVIDRKLESLAAAVLEGQADQLEILKRLEEMGGLIVDLLS